MKEKTVFILGAGFSKEASAPSQEEIVKKIFEINEDNSMSPAIQEFESFLTNTLLIPRDHYNEVPLEDIFTPLDRCIEDNISFRNLNHDEVIKMRELIYFLIGKTFDTILRRSTKEYIDIFAQYITNKSSLRQNGKYKSIDPVSVISTNWDILLDNSIKSKIGNQKGVVDYCCYVSSFQSDDNSIMPGLEMLGSGGFNVKLLKLHGSLNWLQCPRCLRVYVDFDSKISVNQYSTKEKCRHCNDNFGTHSSHQLISNLIMPTFLKDFSNPQYKLIWQNAGIELSEASKIVFIGYSLPYADFEMRQLISRMTRKNAEIIVVDYENTNSRDSRIKMNETKKRFQVFFGKRKMTFYTKGAKDFILNDLRYLDKIGTVSSIDTN